jgi:hypothetical protein
MEHFTDIPAQEQLKAISDDRKTSISVLDPQSTTAGVTDKFWQLKINREVSPDI